MSYFLTGSRVYGTPSEESDVDLALLIDGESLSLLKSFADKALIESRGGHDSLRFGKLNLLTFNDPDEFEAWRRATEALKKRRPVTKEEAIAEIDKELIKLEVVKDA